VTVEETWAADELEYFKSLGYEIKKVPKGGLCRAGAVTFNPETGECAGMLQ